MTLLTAMEIASNYPQNILIEAAQDNKTSKWTSFMYRLKGDDFHKVMLSFNISDDFVGWDTKEEALNAMHDIAKKAIDYVNKM